MSGPVTVIHTWGSALKLSVLFLGAGALGGALLCGAAVLSAKQPERAPGVRCVPPLRGDGPRPAINGRPVIVKSILEPRPGRRLTYTIDFGDGSPPLDGTVRARTLWASHVYPDSGVGARYTTTFTVIDAASGEAAVSTYGIEFVAPSTETKTAIALDDALWWLHCNQRTEEHPVDGPIGWWNENYYPVASTAMAALAFEVNGFDSRCERAEHPYAETVDRALAFVLSRTRKVELASSPILERDANGFGLTVPGVRSGYELPLVAMALVGSRAADRKATCGVEGVHGRTYEAIVTDMLETLWKGQMSAGPYRGGWRYTLNADGADMSVTQWPVLAMMSAEEIFAVETPSQVKEALASGFLARAQGPSGGFGYMGAQNPTVRMTGAGLIALSFVQGEADRVARATEFVATHWDEGNVGDAYAMYAVMKGAKLNAELQTFGEHDWRAEYADHLYKTQRTADGQWNEHEHAHGALAVAWPALILSQDVFATARPAELTWKTIAAAAGGAAFLFSALILGTLFYRAPGPPSR